MHTPEHTGSDLKHPIKDAFLPELNTKFLNIDSAQFPSPDGSPTIRVERNPTGKRALR